MRNLQICALFVRQQVDDSDKLRAIYIVDCVFCTHERDLAMHCRYFLFLSRSGPNASENGCCACERETEPKCVSLTPNA